MRVCTILFTLIVLIAPVTAKERRAITVFAAASLTDVLPVVAAAWAESEGGGEVTFSFDSSSRLAPQIEQGAPADVFISADEEWMDWVAERELITADSRKIIASNVLVTVVPKDAAYVPKDAKGLADKRIKVLALAGETVPAGKYAYNALAKLGVWDSVADRLIRGTNVRATLAYVATREADAGVVYRTDALADGRVKIAFRFPVDSYPAIIYPAAVVKTSTNQETAARFIAFCRSAAGQRILEKHAFLPPPDQTS